MQRALRWMPLALAALGAAALAGAAFACTAQAYIVTQPGEATAGSTITVRGQQWVPDTPVEIYWVNSEGPHLATAVPGEAADFSVQVVVPDVEPGNYTVYAVSHDEEGNFLGSSSYGFTVSAPPGAGETAPAEPVTEQTTSGAPEGRADNGRARPGGERGGEQPAPALISGSTVVGGQEVFTASLGRERPRAQAERPQKAAAVPPSERFGPGRDPGLRTEAAPGLPALQSGSPGGERAPSSAGVVLLALGLIGLAGGALAAELLRRKAPAEPR